LRIVDDGVQGELSGKLARAALVLLLAGLALGVTAVSHHLAAVWATALATVLASTWLLDGVDRDTDWAVVVVEVLIAVAAVTVVGLKAYGDVLFAAMALEGLTLYWACYLVWWR